MDLFFFRVLLGDGANDRLTPIAVVEPDLGAMWHGRVEAVADGRYVNVRDFVEAFPDAPGTRGSRFRGPMIDTTSSELGQVHLFTTAGGIIDRIVVDADGVRRERIGRVQLPEGHVLRAAADTGDDSLVLATYTQDAERGGIGSHLWTAATTGTPAPVAPTPFVTIEWSFWDARICWPATGEPLDTSGWRLGPALAAGVAPIGDNCAFVVRDLEATPAGEPPDSDPPWPPGWRVFEGDIPGAGHLRAFEPNEHFAITFVNPVLTGSPRTWLAGGGFMEAFCPEDLSCFALEYTPGGIPIGTVVHYPRFVGGGVGREVVDQTGAGFWVKASLIEYPDGGCARVARQRRSTVSRSADPVRRSSKGSAIHRSRCAAVVSSPQVRPGPCTCSRTERWSRSRCPPTGASRRPS